MNETQTVTIPITQTISTSGANGTYPGPYTIQVPYTTQGTIVPWLSGGSGVTSWPMGGVEAAIPKKPRKPRTKKVLPAHEQEMKDAEAKWKKILDGKK